MKYKVLFLAILVAIINFLDFIFIRFLFKVGLGMDNWVDKFWNYILYFFFLYMFFMILFFMCRSVILILWLLIIYLVFGTLLYIFISIVDKLFVF